VRRESAADAVRRKARQVQLARRRQPSLWRHLEQVGVLGWVFMLPVLLGLFLGHLVAGRVGTRAPVLVGLFGGLAVGAWAAWRQVRRALEDHSDEGET
jgi:ATP synthase protein I